jgi:hypothetical protein
MPSRIQVYNMLGANQLCFTFPSWACNFVIEIVRISDAKLEFPTEFQRIVASFFRTGWVGPSVLVF